LVRLLRDYGNARCDSRVTRDIKKTAKLRRINDCIVITPPEARGETRGAPRFKFAL